MSAENIFVRARIDAKTKELATQALDAMGLTTSDVIRFLMIRIATEQCVPFEIKIPNVATRRAIAELEAGKGKKSNSVEELMKDLYADV